MTNQTKANDALASTNQLKRIFDQSLAILNKGKDSPGTKTLTGKSFPIHIDTVNLQKRALSEAAQALAALWKVSPTRVTLHSREMHYGRSTP